MYNNEFIVFGYVTALIKYLKTKTTFVREFLTN